MNCFNKTNQQFRDGWNEWIQSWKDVKWKLAFKHFRQEILPVIVGFVSFVTFAVVGIEFVMPLMEGVINTHVTGLAFAIILTIVSGFLAFYLAVLCCNCAEKQEE